jgi:hypothetical protein
MTEKHRDLPVKAEVLSLTNQQEILECKLSFFHIIHLNVSQYSLHCYHPLNLTAHNMKSWVRRTQCIKNKQYKIFRLLSGWIHPPNKMKEAIRPKIDTLNSKTTYRSPDSLLLLRLALQVNARR